MKRRLQWAILGAAALLAAGCDLAEVSIAPGEDVVVVEALLRTDTERQEVLLHRALQGRFTGGVPGATVVVTGDDGRAHPLLASKDCFHIDPAYVESDSIDFRGSCYSAAAADTGWVRPGGTFDLRVQTADGRVIRGRTHVPGAYSVPSLPDRGEGNAACSLAPDSGFVLLWTQSAGAASYVADLSIFGLTGRLPGIGTPPEPLELRGLAVSESDTTIAMPSEFGVFERFNYDSELLKAIQNGFPEGVSIDLALAAADRNWVNSVRGGNFNPSGLIRISTVVGDGVGVFGALSVKHATIIVRKRSSLPRCGLRPG